jgi:hypothetical protein
MGKQITGKPTTIIFPMDTPEQREEHRRFLDLLNQSRQRRAREQAAAVAPPDGETPKP